MFNLSDGRRGTSGGLPPADGDGVHPAGDVVPSPVRVAVEDRAVLLVVVVVWLLRTPENGLDLDQLPTHPSPDVLKWRQPPVNKCQVIAVGPGYHSQHGDEKNRPSAETGPAVLWTDLSSGGKWEMREI